MFKWIQNTRGSALAMVLIVMVVLSILGIAILNVSMGETKLSVNHETQIQAEDIARSGVDAAAKFFLENPSTTVTHIADTDLGKGSFSVDITKPNTNTVVLESIGVIGNIEKKVSTVLTRINYMDLFRGIRQTGTDDLDLGALPITHDPGDTVMIEANTDSIDDISLTSANEADSNIVKAINSSPLSPVTPPSTSGYTTVTSMSGNNELFGNYKIGSLSKGNKKTLILNTKDELDPDHVPDQDIFIVVDYLDFQGAHGEVKIVGDGSVHLFILEGGEINTPVVVNGGDSGHLFIYVAAGKSLELQANADLSAYIYAPEATIEIQSNSTQVNGAIIGEILQRNSVQGPHGKFHYVPLTEEPEDSAINGYKKYMYME